MEGVYTFAVATAISVVIVNLVGFRPNKLTVLLITLLYVKAIAVWFIPIFPATKATDGDVTNNLVGIILGGFLGASISSLWFAQSYDLDEEAIGCAIIAWLVVAIAIWCGVKVVHGVTQHPLYKEPNRYEGMAYATEWTAEPTGVETVIYENDKDITVQMKTEYGWTDISTIEDESALVYGRKFRVTKDGEYVDIPSTDVDFVETSGLSTGSYKSIAKVRVTKVKLVERLHKEVLLANPNYVLRQNTSNKVVVEYEVTNADEVKQHLSEDEQREQKKAQTKEQLQQFITPPKGD